VTRRRFLQLGAGGTGILAPWLSRGQTVPAPSVGRARARRLLVLGASFGGISAALTVRRLAPDVEVVLLEKAAAFVFAPGALRYLFGLVPLDAITRAYAGLEAAGLRVRATTVVAIDRAARRVTTTDGVVDYDQLLIATGLRLAYEDIPGLGEPPGPNLCPYDLGPPLSALRRRIAGFRGGHVVVATPSTPYKCPPAPYEYALLWAAYLRRRGLKGHVTLVDPRSRPTPPAVAPGLLTAMEAAKEFLTYEPFTRVLSVDPAARSVDTEVGKLRFDVLSLVPPHKVVAPVADAELGDPWVEVDPQTFRSTRDERIYALGDTADTPYARTASTASLCGKIAGQYIARAFGATAADPGAPKNVCYPMVSPDRALRLEIDWSFERDPAGQIRVVATGKSDNEPTAASMRLRREWELHLLREMFGT
jgi:sulfide dehydrogenase [flavocytochrome c] flavoprotein chain